MQPDIDLAPVNSIDGKPVDKIGIGRPAEPRKERDPRGQCVTAPAKACDRAVDPRAGCAIQPVRRVLKDRFEPPAQDHQGAKDGVERGDGGFDGGDGRPIKPGGFGFKAVTGIFGIGTGIDLPADGGEQGLHGSEGRAIGDPLEPSVSGQGHRGVGRGGNRVSAFGIIARHIAKPRRKPAPAPARPAFGADDPAAQLNRFLPRERGCEHGIGGIGEMMPFVEDDSCRRISAFPPPSRIDHHQCMIGDDEIGLRGRPRRAFNEAFPVVRATGIHAFATAVGECRRSVAAEQGREPAGKIPAHHISIARVGGPAGDELRKDGRPSCEAALKRIFQIEQAEVILSPLANDHLGAPLPAIGVEPGAFAIKLSLKGLCEG